MGEAGLSAAEVGKEIGEHNRHHGGGDERLRWVSIAEAVLLAVVAVMAAWSGYASAKWTTESRVLLSQASTARTEANRAAIEADEARNFDEEVFAIWFSARTSGDPDAVAQAERLFSPNMAAAVDAWSAGEPGADPADPDAPRGPTAMPDYDLPGAEQAAELDARADELFAEGEEAGFTADDYIANTLYLATVLFLVGISGHFRIRAARIGLVTVGLAITVFAAIQLLGLDRPPG
jgi:hypothetical protein